VFLVAIAIVLIPLALALVCHQALDWMHVKLFTLSKTRSSNAKM